MNCRRDRLIVLSDETIKSSWEIRKEESYQSYSKHVNSKQSCSLSPMKRVQTVRRGPTNNGRTTVRTESGSTLGSYVSQSVESRDRNRDTDGAIDRPPRETRTGSRSRVCIGPLREGRTPTSKDRRT